jgi:hypothetical protein
VMLAVVLHLSKHGVRHCYLVPAAQRYLSHDAAVDPTANVIMVGLFRSGAFLCSAKQGKRATV